MLAGCLWRLLSTGTTSAPSVNGNRNWQGATFLPEGPIGRRTRHHAARLRMKGGDHRQRMVAGVMSKSRTKAATFAEQDRGLCVFNMCVGSGSGAPIAQAFERQQAQDNFTLTPRFQYGLPDSHGKAQRPYARKCGVGLVNDSRCACYASA